MKKTTEVFLRALEELVYGQLELELPDGTKHHFAGGKPGPKAHLRLHEEGVIPNMILRGNMAFANDYRAGKWDSNDLAALLECGLRNSGPLQRYTRGSKTLQLLTGLSYLFRQNTRRGSRRNIHYHYDLGNDFYALWLDRTMTYSSALFNDATDDLTTAQHHKYDRILELLGDTPQQVVDIGCGWGGFVERGVETAGHQVEGITISPSQHEYACKRLHKHHTQAAIRLQDYRALRGNYDAVVSIEMFEAVGERYWNSFFRKIKSILNNKGRAVIQAITIDDEYFDDYRRGGDVIRSYIFPGGMLPCPTRFKRDAARAGLQITDQYFFGADYARTLQHWLGRFERQSEALLALNFDQPFRRLWRFYLASCIGAFRAQRTNVMQVALRHA